MTGWWKLVFPFNATELKSHDEKDGDPYLNKDGLVDFKPDDPDNPRNWSAARRWWITACMIFMVFNGGFASGVPSGCITSLTSYFGVSEEAANLSITLYLLGYCGGPFLFAPLSEFYGRRWVLYGASFAFLGFTFLCAYPPNFGSFLVGRLLAGTFVSALISSAPGVFTDLWEPLRRDQSLILFATATWPAPNIAVVAAAFVDEARNWRWAFYLVLMLGGLNTLLLFTVPETHAPSILYQKAKHIRKMKISGYEEVKAPSEANNETLLGNYKIALTRPWALTFDTISLLCNTYLGVIFTLQFMIFSIYPIVFQDQRGMSASIAQLPLLGVLVGTLLATCILLYDAQWREGLARRTGSSNPERRLIMAMIGAVGFPVTMFWFAWTAHYPSIHWVVPTLAGTFLSTSLMLVFVAYFNYLIDAYSDAAASQAAVNTFFRSIGAAAAPLFTTFMFDAMGVGGGSSLIGGVAVLMVFIPFYFHRYGKRIRTKSKYATSDQEGSGQNDEEDSR